MTWERTHAEARVLMIVNAWPHRERPVHAPFVQHTVDGLEASGLACDVLFIRGYRGLHTYLLGCLAMVLLPWTKRGKYRLVHSHGGETAVVARFYHGAPVLASYWGSDILGPSAGDVHERIRRFAGSRLLRAHSLLLTATTTKSNEMARVLPRSTQRRNWVIPDGIDRSRFKPVDREDARRRLGWSPDEITVISVGRVDPVKRLWLAEQATALAAEHTQGLRWRLLSHVPPEQMPLHYSAADCLIHTSASEGSPNAVKEALACNLPIVATPSGDIAELLQGVIPSALCAADPKVLAHAIVRCVAGRPRSNGRERTRHLGLDEISARMLECYASIGFDAAASQVISPAVPDTATH